MLFTSFYNPYATFAVVVLPSLGWKKQAITLLAIKGEHPYRIPNTGDHLWCSGAFYSMLTDVMNSKIREAKQLLLDIINILRPGNPLMIKIICLASIEYTIDLIDIH